MDQFSFNLPALFAIAIPLTFLFTVRWLDLYSSSNLRMIVACISWGILVSAVSLRLNSALVPILGLESVATRLAPITEEILKSLLLIYLVRQTKFHYFVDGAILGFAIGTGFTVGENLRFLTGAGTSQDLILTLGRVFSTSLMHSSATALVGISLGLFRLEKGNTRMVGLVLGWVAAIFGHFIFNTNLFAGSQSSLLTIGVALGLGIGGLLITVLFISWGLYEEKKILESTLRKGAGIRAGEATIIQSIADHDMLFDPIEERFGTKKRKQVEAILQIEAQIGLKRNIQEETDDPKLEKQLASEIAALKKDARSKRREVGYYCMAYVRSVLPQTIYAARRQQRRKSQARIMAVQNLRDKLESSTLRLARRSERTVGLKLRELGRSERTVGLKLRELGRSASANFVRFLHSSGESTMSKIREYRRALRSKFSSTKQIKLQAGKLKNKIVGSIARTNR
ncbi:MAG: PrsW family intramembrane metalloprotease [Chloroflexi bacterium]|nr:PrsW family intramembrane metalloprotease [Chloroflexota bacterium]